MDSESRMEIIAANVNSDLSVRALRSLVHGHRSTIGDWIIDGDKWIIEYGTKVKVSECLFNYGYSQYTRAPQTITTKSVEIPKPISVLPDDGENVFVSLLLYPGKVLSQTIVVSKGSLNSLEILLKQRRLHLTAEAAIAHSKADIEAAGGVWE